MQRVAWFAVFILGATTGCGDDGGGGPSSGGGGQGAAGTGAGGASSGAGGQGAASQGAGGQGGASGGVGGVGGQGGGVGGQGGDTGGGFSCPLDGNGEPQISCATNIDCTACPVGHQVCDTALGSCGACTDADTSQCPFPAVCNAGACSPICGEPCQDDADCATCAGATACNANQCAECSPTSPCSNGEACIPNGTCQAVCGLDASGACGASGDCAACALAATCHGGPADICGPTGAAGCNELGPPGVAVLPDPWNASTQLCSNPGDCAGVNAAFNVGAALRALTGNDQIGDANVQYGMHQCAGVEISNTISCGICVPCLTDSDCPDIDVSGAVGEQLFGPQGSLSAALLAYQTFGDQSHTVPMYCEAVGVGYGACAPCPSLHSDCSAN